LKPQPYGPFPFWPAPERPRLEWPGRAQLAFYVVPNIEFFDLREPMPGDNNERVPKERAKIPFVYSWAHRDYGNRVGLWRLVDVMQRHGVRGTVALNSDVCKYHPEVIQACMSLEWEFMGHGRTNAVRLNEMPPEEEPRVIAEVLSTIERSTGARPRGWLGSGLAETWNTLDHLVAQGCHYVCDWVNDDQPYYMGIGGKSIVSMPYSWETNDILIISDKISTDEFELICKRQFDTLYREGERSGKVLALCLHPFVIGVPHRIDMLDRVLAYIVGHPRVWTTTAGEIHDHFVRNYPKEKFDRQGASVLETNP
jgi:peptidoglycan/xylan/chitin deacetylase (PgdA/CDA1 family)